MSVEDFQSILQEMVNDNEIEANAVIGVYNIHKQTMLVVPYWECDEAEELPKRLARFLATFADVSGTGESIGAFAFAQGFEHYFTDEGTQQNIHEDAERQTEKVVMGNQELEAKH